MTSRSHNYNFALQKYMLLQEQHEELCSHLDQIRPGRSPLSGASIYSPATSPTRTSSFSSTLSTTSSSSSASSSRRHSRSSERRHSRPQARCSGWDEARDALGTIVDEETLYEISAEEQRLCDVNESIKRALTELLNCDAVRSDQQMRMWVQGRLMETEKELRSGRRRKSSGE